MSDKYACEYPRFKENISGHSMEVILDNGLHRHLRFARKGSNVYHFNITTWPGYLCISGDVGCYVFSRLPDMFEFFREDHGNINPSYWAEKIQSEARHESCMSYSEGRFRKIIKEEFESFADRLNLTDEEKAKLFERVEDEVLSAEGESDAFDKAYGFKHEKRQVFPDFYEHSLKEYTFTYIWCLYAIVYAINTYDGLKNPEGSSK